MSVFHFQSFTLPESNLAGIQVFLVSDSRVLVSVSRSLVSDSRFVVSDSWPFLVSDSQILGSNSHISF